MRVFYMGTPDFAKTVLAGLIASDNEVVGVATQPDRAKNRGKKIQFTPVKELAIENNIEVFQPEKVKNNSEFFLQLKSLNPDVIVVAAYGQIIPIEILELPKYGCINVHASLLPRLRGAAPIQKAILDGDEITGVTIMQMGVGLDDGDIISKSEVKIMDMNFQELHDKLAEVGTDLLVKTLDDIKNGNFTLTKQEENLVTYAGKISKQDGKLDFSKEPEIIERLVRAFDPWPGAYCDYNDKVMKIWKCEICEDVNDEVNGKILEVNDDKFLVSAGSRGLWIKEIQMPGKKRVAVKDYLKGNNIEKGLILG